MNALATSLVQSNRLATIFGPPARASTTMRYSRDLWGNEKETPGVTPETESLILLIATLESRRKASVFLLDSALLLCLSPFLLFRIFFSPLEVELFFNIALLLALLLGRENASRAVRRTNRRRLSGTEDKPCLLQGPRGDWREGRK